MITPEQVWQWMGQSSRREGQNDADGIMTRIVEGVEALWLDQWAPALATRKVTFTASDDLATLTNHHLSDGDPVVFVRQTDAAPLAQNVTYYVRDATVDTFKVAATVGGVAIDVTDNGSAYVWVGPRPTYIDQGLIMQAAALYNRRTILNGVVAGTDTMGPFRVGRFDPDIERLINPGGWAVA